MPKAPPIDNTERQRNAIERVDSAMQSLAQALRTGVDVPLRTHAVLARWAEYQEISRLAKQDAKATARVTPPHTAYRAALWVTR